MLVIFVFFLSWITSCLSRILLNGKKAFSFLFKLLNFLFAWKNHMLPWYHQKIIVHMTAMRWTDKNMQPFFGNCIQCHSLSERLPLFIIKKSKSYNKASQHTNTPPTLLHTLIKFRIGTSCKTGSIDHFVFENCLLAGQKYIRIPAKGSLFFFC